MSKTDPEMLARTPDPDRLVVSGKVGVVEITTDAQRLMATMLMKLTEMAMEVGKSDGREGLAAFHAAMQYLSTTKQPQDIADRCGELHQWAASTGLDVM